MKERLYETGNKVDIPNQHEKNERIFIAPVDGVYKFKGIKLVMRLAKGESVDLGYYVDLFNSKTKEVGL